MMILYLYKGYIIAHSNNTNAIAAANEALTGVKCGTNTVLINVAVKVCGLAVISHFYGAHNTRYNIGQHISGYGVHAECYKAEWRGALVIINVYQPI